MRFFLYIFLIINASVFACTDFRIKASDQTVLNGRSMEFVLPLQSNWIAFPRGLVHDAKAPNDAKGLNWTSKYGYVAADAFGLGIPVDGLNEKGLSFGYLWFRGAEYPNILKNDVKRALSLSDFGPWLLGNFATIQEVKEGLKSIKVWGEFIPVLQRVPPLHVALHDAKGESLVIEFIEGEMKVYDNPLGVLTNYPTFEWHLTNLRNYLSLTAESTPSVHLEGTILQPIGQGTGLMGLPGDWTPASRFIRMVTLSRFVDTPSNAQECITLAEHLLNTVAVPHGMVRNKEAKDEPTQWACIKDLTNKVLYFRSYDDQSLKSIDLKKLDFDSKQPLKFYPIEQKRTIEDITDKYTVK